MTNPIGEWQDAFENQVANRTNVLDLASHYPYSPERWRLFVDGARVFPEYADPVVNGLDQYSHGRMGGSAPKDVHTLSPNAGETVVLETTERPRYVVAFELAATMAAQLNQELVGDDRLRLGLFDGTDGWFFEQRSDHAPDECELVCLRAGSEIYREGPFDANLVTTAFSRLGLVTGWYNITRQEWERSFSENGKQRNVRIGGPGQSNDDGRGPETGNLPIRFEITADSGTSDLELLAGSAAQVNLGTTRPLTRVKIFEVSHDFATTDAWVPICALRVDPRRDNINTQLSNVKVVEWDGADDVNITVQSHAPSKVQDGSGPLTDSDFDQPGTLSEANNVVEESTAVTQGPDNTGIVGTTASTPGGYQIGYASFRQQGSGSKIQRTNTSSNVKRALPGRDVAIIWGNADNTESVILDVRTEQDW